MTDSSIAVHHTAIRVDDVAWYVEFFSDVFRMTVAAADDANNPSQVWLSGGVQLVAEANQDTVAGPGVLHHLGFAVDDIEALTMRISRWNLTEIKTNWFALPNGLAIELKPTEEGKK